MDFLTNLVKLFDYYCYKCTVSFVKVLNWLRFIDLVDDVFYFILSSKPYGRLRVIVFVSYFLYVFTHFLIGITPPSFFCRLHTTVDGSVYVFF